MTLHHEEYKRKRHWIIFLLSTQIYTITLSQLIKEERLNFQKELINNHYISTFKE